MDIRARLMSTSRSAAELAEDPADETGWLGFFDRRQFLALAKRGESRLDFAIDRKPAGTALGENERAVDDHVELAGLPGGDLGVLAEAGFECAGQTGRARLIASTRAVENFCSHEGSVAGSSPPLKPPYPPGSNPAARLGRGPGPKNMERH